MRFRMKDERGQAALEYALVGVVVMVAVAGMGMLWRFVSDGRFDGIVFACASHAVSVGGALDVFLF